MIKGCKTIAEYVMRQWMRDHGFEESHFSLEVHDNTGIIRDSRNDTITLKYNGSAKCVYVWDD